mmetsp:Transcript_51509/g.60192  ORF Transcript_51509/g.60192 Transcript_51509/m.60192 type:complete len:105 (+) Transcript_51509:903-1217(+)
MSTPMNTKERAMRNDAKAMEGARLFRLGSDDSIITGGSRHTMMRRRSENISTYSYSDPRVCRITALKFSPIRLKNTVHTASWTVITDTSIMMRNLVPNNASPTS